MAPSVLFCIAFDSRLQTEQITAPSADLVSIIEKPAAPSFVPGATIPLKAFGVYSNNSQ
jgi:hypothetical protein